MLKKKEHRVNKIQAGGDSTANPKTYGEAGVVRVAAVPARDSTEVAAVAPAAAANNAIAIRRVVETTCPLPNITSHIIHPIAIRIEIVNWRRIRMTGKVMWVSKIIVCYGDVYRCPTAVSETAIIIR